MPTPDSALFTSLLDPAKTGGAEESLVKGVKDRAGSNVDLLSHWA